MTLLFGWDKNGKAAREAAALSVAALSKPQALMDDEAADPPAGTIHIRHPQPETDLWTLYTP